MPDRPWALPQEVKDYSDYKKVQTRSDEKLKVDIFRAETHVINYTGNRFTDTEKYPELPENVKIAVILIAELYAFNAAESQDGKGGYKSETFDDYSYTLADTDEKIANLSLGSLLDEFIVASSGGSVILKMRKL